MKTKINAVGVILTLLVISFCLIEINNGGKDLYAMDGRLEVEGFDFNTAFTTLKKEKSPISLLNTGRKKDNAIENGKWNNDSRNKLISAGFNPEEFKPEELFGNPDGNGVNYPSDSIPVEATSVWKYTGMAGIAGYFGFSVSSACDVNGDGYDDIIVGAYGYSTYTGRAYIFYGGVTQDFTPDVVLTGEGINNDFGYSVSSAGDVNADGYDDVIVGAFYYLSFTGRAYIYYGGISMNTTADVTMTGENIGNHFGNSVSSAGDVNGDGYSDVIVGAYGYSSGTGRAYVYYGGTTMNNTADVTMTGENMDHNFGNSVSSAGDVNGDGYDDVIIGAFYYSSTTGRAYVYYGGEAMDNAPDVTMTGEGTSNFFGGSVSTAGDVNSDGYADVIIGAYYYLSFTGRAYIFYGGTAMDNTADVTMTGETTNNYFGFSVSAAGDVNGDGYADVIVGAEGYSTNTGKAYVYYGGATMDNSADVTMTGENTGHYFGGSVSSAGDVNSDGYADVIVGASHYSSSTGRAYVYINSMTGTDIPDVTMTGESTANYFGYSVSTAGDVNGDGYADVIVGAYNFSLSTGKAYVYYGGAVIDSTADVTMTGEEIDNYFGIAVSTAGDVNGDGYADVIVGAYGHLLNKGKVYIYFGGAEMDATADVTMTGEEIGNYFGTSVSTAGDVNGDGYADVIVGASGYSSGTGRAYLYYGGAVMNNIADVTMTGEAASNHFGTSVSTAGDVNGDGYADVIVGARYYSTSTGRTYIYYGGAVMNNTADVTMTGEAASNNFGTSVSTAGDVNGDGYTDVIVGASGYSSYTGRAYVYYGGAAMNNTADVTMTAEAVINNYGYSVSDAGDVNGDGYADVVVGATGYSINSGRSYVYFGGTAMDNTADVTMTGETNNDYFGVSVSTAGDMNSDGHADLIVGASGYSSGTGKAYLHITQTPLVKPTLVSVKDVPKDEGGNVFVRWARSGYDLIGSNRITEYVIEKSRAPTGGVYAWQFAASIAPQANPVYEYISPTWSDSTPVFFRITAKTSSLTEFWRSNIKSGFSIDNLAPTSPVDVIASTTPTAVNLSWKKNTEPDLKKYRVYRNDTLISESYSNAFTDTVVQGKSNTSAPFIREGEKVKYDNTSETGRLENNTRPVYSYTYEISAVDVHGNEGELSAPLNVNFAPFTRLTLTLIPEGFYNTSTGRLNSKDTITVYLRNINSPYAIVDSAKAVLDSVTFTAEFDFKYAETGMYYYVIKHRNSIETWSKTGGEVFTRGNDASYNFTSANTQAYGNNLIQKGTKWCIYSGDVNQDGAVDLFDLIDLDNDNSNFVTGVTPTDLNGDQAVDLFDLIIGDNNNAAFIAAVKPPGALNYKIPRTPEQQRKADEYKIRIDRAKKEKQENINKQDNGSNNKEKIIIDQKSVNKTKVNN